MWISASCKYLKSHSKKYESLICKSKRNKSSFFFSFHPSFLSASSSSSPHGMQDPQEFCQLETFQAECPADHVILMTSSKYGRMRLDGRCVKRDWGHLGCSVDVLTYLDGLCSGRRSCDLPVADLSGLQPCPADLASFLEVSFRCVKGFVRTCFSLFQKLFVYRFV